MIFISHQNNDKEFVEDIAHSLRETYGKDKVFFDRWSIKPGENILNRMSEGIEECKYFFYFITKNSLQSDMVNLEWTSALKERSKRDIKFIPVRADNVNVPTIISSINYIDLYIQGLGATITEIKGIIEGEEGNQENIPFNNLYSYILEQDDSIKYFITTKKFFEPRSKFMILTTFEKDEAVFNINENGWSETYFNSGALEKNNEILNGFVVNINGGIHKGSFIKLIFSKRIKDSDIRGSGIVVLGHLKTDDYFDHIPGEHIKSEEELPF